MYKKRKSRVPAAHPDAAQVWLILEHFINRTFEGIYFYLLCAQENVCSSALPLDIAPGPLCLCCGRSTNYIFNINILQILMEFEEEKKKNKWHASIQQMYYLM